MPSPAEFHIPTRLSDALALGLAAAAATSHLYTGALGLAVHRKRAPAAWPFGLVMAALAWATFCTGLANAVPTDEAPALVVLSTLLSGYGAPALWLFARQAVWPGRRPSAAWLLLGLPGTIFALRALTDAQLLAFVVDFRHGIGPAWEPRLSPWYLGHAIQLGLSLVLSAVTVGIGLRGAAPGPFRDGLRWIGVSIAIGLLTTVVFTILPGALRIDQVLPFAPAFTLPAVALSARGLRLLADPAVSGMVPRAEAERRRRTAVESAIRGVTSSLAVSLARVDGKLQLLGAPDLPAGERSALLRRVRMRVAELRGLVDQLATFSGATHDAAVPVAVADLVDAAQRRAAVRGRVVQVQPLRAGIPDVLAPAQGLARAVDALLDNAAAAGGPPPVLAIRFEQPAVVPADASAGAIDGCDAICIEVRDEGRGMSADVLAQATEPFFTTRPGARGLGLAEVLAVVRSAGGALHLASTPGSGTVARLWLPVAPAPALSGGLAFSLVALIEDDAMAELLDRLVAARGFRLLRLAGARALDAAAAAGALAGVRAAVLPWRCGDRSATQLLDVLREAAPGVRVVLVGAPDEPTNIHAEALTAARDVVVAPAGAGCAALCALLVAQSSEGSV